MSNPNVIKVDDQEYVRAESVQSIDSPIKIVVLQRGWIMVGKFDKNGSYCKLHNASVIRIWGTTKGLGELALNGPTASTRLDKCHGLVEFDSASIIFSIRVKESVWKNL